MSMQDQSAAQQQQDLSHEAWRQYTYLGPAGVVNLKFDNLKSLSVAPDGHHLVDSQGVVHHVVPGWIHLCWKQKEGQALAVQ